MKTKQLVLTSNECGIQGRTDRMKLSILTHVTDELQLERNSSGFLRVWQLEKLFISGQIRNLCSSHEPYSMRFGTVLNL